MRTIEGVQMYNGRTPERIPTAARTTHRARSGSTMMAHPRPDGSPAAPIRRDTPGGCLTAVRFLVARSPFRPGRALDRLRKPGESADPQQ
jgi:hypothetical protein